METKSRLELLELESKDLIHAMTEIDHRYEEYRSSLSSELDDIVEELNIQLIPGHIYSNLKAIYMTTRSELFDTRFNKVDKISEALQTARLLKTIADFYKEEQ